MPAQPRRTRTRSLAVAAAAQTPWMLAGTALSGFGYLFALLLSGRTVTTWDVTAAFLCCCLTGWTALIVAWRMAHAGDRAIAQQELAHRAATGPTRTQALPAVEQATTLRAVQARVDRARPARARHNRPDPQ